MQLTVEHTEWATEQEWQHIVDTCFWATFFESPDWIKCYDVQQKISHSGHCLKVCLSDSVELFFPISKLKVLKGIQSHITAVPGGLYGGPIAKIIPSVDHIKTAILYLQKNFKNIEFRMNPFLMNLFNVDDVFSEFSFDEFTQAIKLDQSTESIKSALSIHKIDYDARYARKHQLRVEIAQDCDLTSFLSVYDHMKTKWGSVNVEYSNTFFEMLISRENCDFWSVFKENEYIGGGILLKQYEHVSSWLTIMHSDYLKFRPYEFVYEFLIFHYRSTGFKWFDLNPSAGLSGVVSFKEKFGTQKIPIPSFSQSSSILTLSNILRKPFKNA